MESVRIVLEQQPLAALFLTIAIGYLAGEVSVKGFSLGVGAVLFVALAVGWFAPKAVPAPIVGTLGLALFLYAVGVQYGSEFFRGLTSAEGLKANFIALIGVLAAAAVSIALVGGDVKLGYAVGMFAGSGTSTPTLQAALQTFGNDDPAIGYSVTYPFGTAGAILLVYFAFQILKPRFESSARGFQTLEIAIRNPALAGKPLAEVAARLPAGVRIAAMRENDHNALISGEQVLKLDDVLLAVAPTRDLLEQTCAQLGEAASGRITGDRRDLDYLRVFASSAGAVGRTLGELAMVTGVRCTILHLCRGDTEIVARPDLVLESGDRVGLLAHRSSFPELRKFFGDSIKGTAEFSYIGIGLGLALGFLVGAVHIPVPGIGSLSIGLAGVLLVALVLGKLRHTGGIGWTMPLSANLVLRNLGLTLFLAQVGLSSGPKFAATVAQTGFLFLGLGALILLALMVPVLVLGLWLFRMPFDQVAGIVSGLAGNPAVLAYSNKLVPTDRPDVAYAMIFPGMTIVKILLVDIAPAFFA
jgi:putative transport protein